MKKKLFIIALLFISAQLLYSQSDVIIPAGKIIKFNNVSQNNWTSIKSPLLSNDQPDFQVTTTRGIFYIDKEGQVGIGTTNPSCNFHMEASINGELNLLVKNTYGTGTRTYLTAMPGKSLIQTDRDFAISTNGGGWSEKFYITNNGNVGIGTTTPSGLLHLNSNAPYIYLTTTSTTDPEAAIRGVNGTWLFGYGGFSGSEDISIGTQDRTGSRTLTFATGGSAKMKILANGNVGIGTTSPQNKLDVNGTIHAKEVKVDLTGWSDFVFAPTYKLKPLTYVEQYIKTNGHLPEIPSAKEVEQNGVSLGDMQAKLLQKVEELTLYVIEQDKKLQEEDKDKDKDKVKEKTSEQAKQITDLEQKLAAQAKEIEQLKLLITQKLK